MMNHARPHRTARDSLFGITVRVSIAFLFAAVSEIGDVSGQTVAPTPLLAPHVAVGDIMFEPPEFKAGDSIRIVVTLVNLGSQPSGDLVITSTVDDRKLGPPQNVPSLAPLATADLTFPWSRIESKSQPSAIAVYASPSGATATPSKCIFRRRYASGPSGENGMSKLYSVLPPVHQWICLQAYLKLPAGTDLKKEMASYLPTNPSDSFYQSSFTPPALWSNNPDLPAEPGGALIEGAGEEDGWVTSQEVKRVVNHFWDPTGPCDLGFFSWSQSALQRAQYTWKIALDKYKAKDKTAAYYWLGRTAHLLADMSLPAHTLVDPHEYWLGGGDDQYEEFVNGNYARILWTSPGTGIPNVRTLAWYPGGYNTLDYQKPVSKLFYNLAMFSNRFDSDDSGRMDVTAYGAYSVRVGSVTKGAYNHARNTLRQSDFLRADFWTGGPILWRKRKTLVQGTDFFPLLCADENALYYCKSFYDEIEWTAPGTGCISVVYKDNSTENFHMVNLTVFDIPAPPLKYVYLPQLESAAIGYIAALYQVFWNFTHPFVPSPQST